MSKEIKIAEIKLYINIHGKLKKKKCRKIKLKATIQRLWQTGALHLLNQLKDQLHG